jgi:Spy/CpxP family protein refolding chaperone
MMPRICLPLVLLPLLALAPLACDNASSGGSTPAPSAAATSTPQSASAAVTAAPSASAAVEHKRDEHGRRDPTEMLLHAARDLTLTDAEKASIDKIEGTLKTSEQGMGAAFKSAHDDLVGFIKTGKVDNAKVQADDAALEKAMGSHHDDEATAMNSLYAALDPAQRKTLVANIRAKQAAHEQKEGEHEHEAWDAGGPADFAKRKVDHLTKELSLDATQQKQLTTALAKLAPPSPKDMEAHKADMKKHMDALLTGFEGDGFDAKKIDTGMKPAMVHEMVDHQVALLAQLLPILKQDQRDTLAADWQKPSMMEHPGGHEAPSGAGPAEEDEWPAMSH